jgi:hypothetical protein
MKRNDTHISESYSNSCYAKNIQHHSFSYLYPSTRAMKYSFCFLLLFSFTVNAQTSSTTISDYFIAVRDKKTTAVPSALISDRKNEQILFASITPYLSDSVNEVRLAAYSLLANIGKRSAAPLFRKQIVTTLANGWRDADSGISGLVGSSLQQFRQEDFTPIAKDTLRSLVKEIPAYYDKLVTLCGFLSMTEQQPIIQTQLQSGAIKSKSEKWSAYLALCRMGDVQALTYVMNRVRKSGVNDDVVYEVFPDLIYTRQREAIAYLLEALNSNEKNCEPANPEASGNIPCAYRVMEMLAPVIKDFPLKADASGDVIAKDYPKALQQARVWLKQHPDYQIKTDTF